MAFTAHRSFGPFGARVARDPFGEFARGLSLPCVAPDRSQGFVPRIDAVEDDDAFRITAEVPGVDEADLSVEIEEGVLTLKGEKRNSFASDDEGEVSGLDAPASSRFHCVETSFGIFERRLRFGAEVDEKAVSASYRHGVLSIVVPKASEPAPVVRTVPVKTA